MIENYSFDSVDLSRADAERLVTDYAATHDGYFSMADEARQKKRDKSRKQLKAEEVGRIENVAQEGDVQYMAREIMEKDPRSLTESDALMLFDAAKQDYIADKEYFPVRINTPEALRNYVDFIEKLRGVRSDSDITALTADRPLIINGEKARQAMALQEDVEGDSEGHEYTKEEIVDILKRIDRPRYLVYEESSGNYAIVVNYQSALGDKAIVFFDFNQNKDSVYMSGYKGGTYNTVITVYPNSRPGTIKALLDTKKNKVYDPYGKKGNVQRTSGSLVPSVLNTFPYVQNIPQSPEESNTLVQKSARDNSISNRDLLLETKDTDMSASEKKALQEYRAKAEAYRSREQSVTDTLRQYDKLVREGADRTCAPLRRCATMVPSTAEARYAQAQYCRTHL